MRQEQTLDSAPIADGGQGVGYTLSKRYMGTAR